MADIKPSAFTTDATIEDDDWVPYIDKDGGGAGTHLNRKVPVSDFRTAMQNEKVKVVTATQTNTTTTGASITDVAVTGLVAGTYRLRMWIVWQAAATTTGAAFWVNMTGTTTRNVGHVYTTTTGTTATTGVADQATVAATFQMIEARAWRANNTNPGAFGGVDTVNADQFAMLECVVTTTTTGDLQVLFASEVASSGVSVMAGSTLEYEKVA
jgi:hypothetical protein